MELKKFTTRDLFFSILFFLAAGGLMFWGSSKPLISVVVGILFLMYYFIVKPGHIIISVTTVMIASFGFFLTLMSFDTKDPLKIILSVVLFTIIGFLLGSWLQKIYEQDQEDDSEVYEDYPYDEPHIIAAEHLNVCLVKITNGARKNKVRKLLRDAIKSLTDNVDVKEISKENLIIYRKAADNLVEIRKLVKDNGINPYVASISYWKGELEKIQ